MIDLPKEFIEEMRGLLGDELDEFLATFSKEPYKGIRLRHRRGRETGLSFGEKIPWAPGAYYLKEDEAGKSPFHAAGAYYIQEPSAMVPAVVMKYLMDEGKNNLRLLDLCAAPGGKTTQLAEYFEDTAIITANEIHPARAKILSENVERLGFSNVIVINEDPQRLKCIYPSYFHGILVDAPCSGEGMFRKNPEAIGEWSPENVELCAKRQTDILDCALEMLAPGGVLVYSTCTFSKKENEDNMERLIKINKDYRVPDMGQISKELNIHGAVFSELGLRLWPHKVKGEGHFVSAILP